MNSTIHAVLIVTGMVSTLSAQEWDEDLLPLKSTSTAATLFAICEFRLNGISVISAYS